MFRIDDPSAIAALPAPEAAGTEGYFTEGTPGVQNPTLVRGSWLNMIQEELRAIVAAAGLTPSKTVYNQVLTAINMLLQAGPATYAVDTGTANTYQVAYSPAITAVTDGMVLKFKAKTANTGASTFSPNGLAASPIWGCDYAALSGGEIVVNGDVWVQWNISLNGGAGAWILLASGGGISNRGGCLAGIQVFTSSGTYTRSAGVKSAVVEVIGGGGGGAGVPTSSTGQITVGGGGGAGGYAMKRVTAPGTTETVTVGDGGTGGAAGTSGAGGTGGTSSFGTWVSATGGGGGSAMGGATAAFVAPGGLGGTPTGATVGNQGETGDTGFGTYPLVVGGSGGSSRFGAGGTGGNLASVGQSSGATASGFGCGGGGSATAASAQLAGSPGHAGIVIVYEYY